MEYKIAVEFFSSLFHDKIDREILELVIRGLEDDEIIEILLKKTKGVGKNARI